MSRAAIVVGLAILCAAATAHGAPAVRLSAGDPLLPPEGDARAVLRAAEGRTFRLPADGITSFSCLVASPHVDKLWDPGGPLEGHPLGFRLAWRAPGFARVIPLGGEGLEPELLDRIVGLFRAVPEAILAPPMSDALAGHAMTAQRDAAGGVVVEAADPSGAAERAIVRYEIGADGLVSREQVRFRDGTQSDLSFEHVRSGPHVLLARSHGTYRGLGVDLRLTWGASVGKRPVPTRILARQLDPDSGLRLPGGLGEISFVLSGHEIDGGVDPAPGVGGAGP